MWFLFFFAPPLTYYAFVTRGMVMILHCGQRQWDIKLLFSSGSTHCGVGIGIGRSLALEMSYVRFHIFSDTVCALHAPMCNVKFHFLFCIPSDCTKSAKSERFRPSHSRTSSQEGPNLEIANFCGALGGRFKIDLFEQLATQCGRTSNCTTAIGTWDCRHVGKFVC